MMKTKTTQSKFFPIVFGIMGLILLIIAWVYPADTSDRILAAVIGSAGIFGAIIRMPIHKRSSQTESTEKTVGKQV